MAGLVPSGRRYDPSLLDNYYPALMYSDGGSREGHRALPGRADRAGREVPERVGSDGETGKSLQYSLRHPDERELMVPGTNVLRVVAISINKSYFDLVYYNKSCILLDYHNCRCFQKYPLVFRY